MKLYRLDSTPIGNIPITLPDPYMVGAQSVVGIGVWSGKGEPPEIGAVVRCNDRKHTRVTVTNYKLHQGYLMAEGFRTDDPDKNGDLAGAEIDWSER